MLFGFTIAFATISLVSNQWNYSPRSRTIIVLSTTLMSGVAQSMSMIQSYNMGRKTLSGIIDHVWTNFWDLVMYIVLLWQISTTSQLVTFYHSIMSRSKLYLALAMMPCLMIFVTISLTLIVIFISMMMSSSMMTSS